MRSIGTRIGEGLGERGRLGDEPMQRTLDAIRQLARAIRGHYVRMFAIATSALRRADNGEEFMERVHELLGVPLRVLSGEEEAEASYRGALTAFDGGRGERIGVIDVGGGSSECAVGESTYAREGDFVRDRSRPPNRGDTRARGTRRPGCGRRAVARG